ncbi:MAG: hypothetical protein ICV64_09295 [Thermoleophilia bacterium]|nr:hypothetical protein [Thermoleophilia bacterium]
MKGRLTLCLLGVIALAPAALAGGPTARPTSVTIAAEPTVVTFGGTTTLTGAITPARAGERVTVEAQPCGQAAFTRLGDVATAATGSATLTARPTANTQYRARVRNLTSSAVTVTVRPRIRLAKVARQKFRVRVIAGQSLAGRVVTFQRSRPATGTWVRVRSATLREVASAAPTVTSGATFRARVRAGSRVRVVLPHAQAAPCYGGARSNTTRA